MNFNDCLTYELFISMKKYVLVLVVLTIAGNLWAQSERKGYIGISLGPSMPMGDYGDNSFTNEDAGFAKTGLNFNLINFGYKFGERFGIVASWYGAAHSIDIDGVDGTWGYGGLMGGPMLSWPVSEKLDLDVKLMLGYVVAILDLENEKETGDLGLAVDLGATLRYNFAERWALLINLDYFNGSSKINFGGFETIDRKLTTINPTFGIAFRL